MIAVYLLPDGDLSSPGRRNDSNQSNQAMAKVKLELQSKNDEVLRTFTQNHIASITGNPYYPTPKPAAVDFDGKEAVYSARLDEIAAAETALAALRAGKDGLRAELEAALNARAAYVDEASGGDEAKILSAGFEVQAAGSATTSIAAPHGVVATMGDDEGEIDVAWHRDPKSRSFVIEMREHSDMEAPGPWAQAKLSTRSSCTVTGLTSGKRYAFRIRALGPNELESPWSAEVTCMAP